MLQDRQFLQAVADRTGMYISLEVCKMCGLEFTSDLGYVAFVHGKNLRSHFTPLMRWDYQMPNAFVLKPFAASFLDPVCPPHRCATASKGTLTRGTACVVCTATSSRCGPWKVLYWVTATLA